MNQLLKIKDHIRYQQSRNNWIREGDTNSRFFHKSVESKGRMQRINGLRIDGKWREGVVEVKEGASNFFRKRFEKSESWNSGLPGCLEGAKISESEASLLEHNFTLDEIKEIVWACGLEKCPGLDGSNFHFFRRLLGSSSRRLLSSF